MIIICRLHGSSWCLLSSFSIIHYTWQLIKLASCVFNYLKNVYFECEPNGSVLIIWCSQRKVTCKLILFLKESTRNCIDISRINCDVRNRMPLSCSLLDFVSWIRSSNTNNFASLSVVLSISLTYLIVKNCKYIVQNIFFCQFEIFEKDIGINVNLYRQQATCILIEQ